MVLTDLSFYPVDFCGVTVRATDTLLILLRAQDRVAGGI